MVNDRGGFKKQKKNKKQNVKAVLVNIHCPEHGLLSSEAPKTDELKLSHDSMKMKISMHRIKSPTSFILNSGSYQNHTPHKILPLYLLLKKMYR